MSASQLCRTSVQQHSYVYFNNNLLLKCGECVYFFIIYIQVIQLSECKFGKCSKCRIGIICCVGVHPGTRSPVMINFLFLAGAMADGILEVFCFELLTGGERSPAQ